MAHQQRHPTHAQPEPPFSQEEQRPPGREADMQPLADHGEDSYVGHGRLTDRVALITGADSGIGRAVALAYAREGAERGIRVNAVAPGPIWTPLVAMSFPAEKLEQFGSDTPLGRPGQPGELAPLYVFLASEDSRYISGEVIGATGGTPLH